MNSARPPHEKPNPLRQRQSSPRRRGERRGSAEKTILFLPFSAFSPFPLRLRGELSPPASQKPNPLRQRQSSPRRRGERRGSAEKTILFLPFSAFSPFPLRLRGELSPARLTETESPARSGSPHRADAENAEEARRKQFSFCLSPRFLPSLCVSAVNSARPPHRNRIPCASGSPHRGDAENAEEARRKQFSFCLSPRFLPSLCVSAVNSARPPHRNRIPCASGSPHRADAENAEEARRKQFSFCLSPRFLPSLCVSAVNSARPPHRKPNPLRQRQSSPRRRGERRGSAEKTILFLPFSAFSPFPLRLRGELSPPASQKPNPLRQRQSSPRRRGERRGSAEKTILFLPFSAFSPFPLRLRGELSPPASQKPNPLRQRQSSPRRRGERRGSAEKTILFLPFSAFSPFPLRLRGELSPPASQKPNPLRQRQLRRPVDGVGLAAHVGLPGIAAGFAAAAGFLLAAEGAADLRAAGADVDVGDAAVAAAVAQEGLGRRSGWSVNIADERPCGTSLCQWMASSRSSNSTRYRIGAKISSFRIGMSGLRAHQRGLARSSP